VYISAKADYALRALVTLAAEDRPLTADALARSQGIPVNYLGNILLELRRSGLLVSHRGAEGGYQLTRPAAQVSAADVMRAIEGPLAEVRGLRPEATEYTGAAVHLRDLWIAVRANLRGVLEHVTLADLAAGRFPAPIRRLVADDDSWRPR
jgi:Rrf2 family protein